MDPIVKKKYQEEERHICIRGYAVRSFQEDNNKKASWAYTVGLQSNLKPICLFVRAAVDAETLDAVLSDISDYIKTHGVPRHEFSFGQYKLDIEEKIRFKLKKVKLGLIDSLKDKFGNYVEGQKEDSTYYWVFIADSKNILPGEEGYTDFKQFSDTEESTDLVETSKLIETFDDINET